MNILEPDGSPFVLTRPAFEAACMIVFFAGIGGCLTGIGLEIAYGALRYLAPTIIALIVIPAGVSMTWDLRMIAEEREGRCR